MTQNDGAASAIDFATVVVVARSPINRIVLAKIVERSSLRPVVEAPDTAAATLRSLIPAAIVLDGGVDNTECDHLASLLETLKCSTGGTAPVVILLSNRVGTAQSLGLPEIVDAVVAKPITPEKLQPVIERLIAVARA